MKVVITGHTSGLGRALYNHMISMSHNVVGYSRSTGHTLPDSVEYIVEQAKMGDLFINNTHCGTVQCDFLRALHNIVPIITCGSMGAEIGKDSQNPYYAQKYAVEQTHKQLKRRTRNPMLLLRMGYLENYADKHPIMYSEVISAVEYWLQNPRVSMIEIENRPEVYTAMFKNT